MSISLYDATVATYLQGLAAVGGFLTKGREYAEAEQIPLTDLLELRIHPEMLPLRFQLISVVHHSLGALRGAEAGEFGPPQRSEPDFDSLARRVADTHAELATVSRADVEKLEGRDVTFKMGEFKVPFTAADFLLSFSIPNFFFHATTAYDILRMRGVPLGKRDFMGALRIKR